MADKTLRWLYLFDILPSHGLGMTTEDIHRTIVDRPDAGGISLRTVQRDLREIEESGLLSFVRGASLDGKPTVRVDGSFKGLEGRVMSQPAAMALMLVLKHSMALLPLAAQKQLRSQEERAKKVLQAGSEPRNVPWLSKVRVLPSGHNLKSANVDEDVLATVYASLATDTKLRATYRTPNGKISTREYSLLGLISRPPLFHLVVSLDPGKEPFQLALARITRAESIALRAIRPSGFDLDEFIARGAVDIVFEPKQIRIIVRVEKGVGERWREAPLGTNQTIEEGAKWLVSADVPNTMALRAHLLGWASQVEVVEPAELRGWMQQQAQGMARSYEAESTDSAQTCGSSVPSFS